MSARSTGKTASVEESFRHNSITFRTGCLMLILNGASSTSPEGKFSKGSTSTMPLLPEYTRWGEGRED